MYVAKRLIIFTLNVKVYTIPEFLKRRFGGKRLRIYHSLILQLSYIVTKISVCSKDIFQIFYLSAAI